MVNISSVAGLCAVPVQAAYNSSKFAIRGFTETLSQELAGAGVTVSSVYPGTIKTDIYLKARFKSTKGLIEDQREVVDAFEKMARTTPAQAAAKIVNGIKKRKTPGDCGARRPCV